MHQEFPGGDRQCAKCSNLGSKAQISSSRISREVPITAAIYNSNLVKLPFCLGPVRGFGSVNK